MHFLSLIHFSWLSALESTKWLQHLSIMLKAAVLVSNAVDREGRPVLIHCSDGWDRTPQIVALAKILLDPYYRTMEVFGFSCLSSSEVAFRRILTYLGDAVQNCLKQSIFPPSFCLSDLQLEAIDVCLIFFFGLG